MAGKHIDDELEPPGDTFDGGDCDYRINTFLRKAAAIRHCRTQEEAFSTLGRLHNSRP